MKSSMQSACNKDSIALVVVGYNRYRSLKRLLDSLSAATYPVRVPLVISIDASGDKRVYELAESFKWPYGDKYVKIHDTRLGLKDHIYWCGDLTRYFKAIVLLEDDLFVSPFFFDYVTAAVEKYGEDDRIAEISLYKNESNGYVGLPFHQQDTGSDVFLMQDVSTWGECWTESMWQRFVDWRGTHSEEYVLGVDMPEAIKQWTRAWSKYFNAYVVDTSRYCLYPCTPVSTNFSDAGEHGGDNNSLVQVNMLYGRKSYDFRDFSSLVKYDIYFNNESLYDWLSIDRSKLNLDIYGFFRSGRTDRQYLLSTRVLPYKVCRSFAMNLRPMEMNIAYGIDGRDIFLYDTSIYEACKKSGTYSKNVVKYFLQGMWPRSVLCYAISHYMTRFFGNAFLGKNKK